MRLFVAIELPEAVRREMVRLADRLQERLGQDAKGISWLKPENLHITLKFLAEVEEPRVSALCNALASVEPVGEIALKASNLELMPKRGPLRIMSTGMDGDLHRLSELHRRIESACAQLGFPTERRKFLPHITFARIKRRPATPPHEIEHYAREFLPTRTMAAHEFVLMESRLKKEGAEYVRLGKFSILQPTSPPGPPS